MNKSKNQIRIRLAEVLPSLDVVGRVYPDGSTSLECFIDHVDDANPNSVLLLSAVHETLQHATTGRPIPGSPVDMLIKSGLLLGLISIEMAPSILPGSTFALMTSALARSVTSVARATLVSDKGELRTSMLEALRSLSFDISIPKSSSANTKVLVVQTSKGPLLICELSRITGFTE